MKLSVFTVFISLTFVLTACNKQGSSEKFAGFTAIGKDNAAAKFYIETNTAKRGKNGLTSFNMIRMVQDGYVIQNAETDCKSHFNAFEGVKYREDGTSQEKFIAESLTLPIKDNPDINTLVSVACDKAEENRIFSGNFDDIKALEILYGSYQPNTQTALWDKIDPPKTLDGYESFLGISGTVKILESKDFTQQGKTKHIVLTSTSVGYSPHVLLSAAVFVKIDDKWHVETEYPYLKITKNGLPETMRLEQIGKEHYGIFLDTTTHVESVNDSSIFKKILDKYGIISNKQSNIFLYELIDSGLNVILEYHQYENIYINSLSENVFNKLGWCYANGIGVPLNYAEATKWYAKAALKPSVLNNNDDSKNDIESCKQTLVNAEQVNTETGAKINFADLNQEYSDAMLTLDNGAIKAQTIYQFQHGNGYIPLWENALNELVSLNSGKNELSSPWLEQSFPYDNDSFHSIFIQTIDKYGDPGNGIIGAVNYKEVNGKWIIVSKQKNIGFTDVASWDAEPELPLVLSKIIQLSSDKSIFFLEDKSKDQKKFDVGLFILSNNNWRYVGLIRNSKNNSNGCESDSIYKCFKISVIKSNKEYPDLLVTKTGMEIDNKEDIVPAKNDIYVFNGKTYEIKENNKTLSASKEIKNVQKNSAKLDGNYSKEWWTKPGAAGFWYSNTRQKCIRVSNLPQIISKIGIVDPSTYTQNPAQVLTIKLNILDEFNVTSYSYARTLGACEVQNKGKT